MLNKYVMRYKFRFTLSLLLDFFWSIPFVAIPYVMGEIIDRLGSNTSVTDLESHVFQLLLILLALTVVQYLFMSSSQYFAAASIANITRDIRADMFNALQEQSHRYYDEENTGNLVAKTTRDIVSVVNFYRMITLEGGLLLGKLLFISVVLFYIDIQLGIIALIAVPIMVVITKFFESRNTPVQFAAREQNGKMTGQVNETIDTITLTKIYNIQEQNITSFRSTLQDLRETNLRSKRMSALLNVQSPLLTGLVITMFLVIGGLRVLHGDLTVGQLITVLLLANYLQGAVAVIGGLGQFYSGYSASKSRIIKVLQSSPDIVSPEHALILDPQQQEPSIVFDDVSFGYNESMVLNSISLTIPAHATVSVLGSSGSGKSALINLIPRFYDPSHGSVRIGGHDLREYDLLTLRQQIGFVDQETFLFSRSIRENICFGRPNATIEEVIAVAKTAQIHDFIASLEDGYDTVIGERGITLSGGQRQRLSIARALLIDPPIIIFDDSLSAVDLKTEHQIQQALEALIVNRTVIFVTQRLSTTKSSDLCVILHSGKIIETGSHDELLQHDGPYSRLFKAQVDDLLDLSFIDTPEINEVKEENL